MASAILAYRHAVRKFWVIQMGPPIIAIMEATVTRDAEGEADAEQGHGATEQRADEVHPAVRLFVAHVAVENFVGAAVVAFTHLLFGAEAGDGAQTGGDVGGA